MIPNEHIVRALAEALPARIRAARSTGLSVKLTLVEAQAARALLDRELSRIEADAIDERRTR